MQRLVKEARARKQEAAETQPDAEPAPRATPAPAAVPAPNAANPAARTPADQPPAAWPGAVTAVVESFTDGLEDVPPVPAMARDQNRQTNGTMNVATSPNMISSGSPSFQ